MAENLVMILATLIGFALGGFWVNRVYAAAAKAKKRNARRRPASAGARRALHRRKTRAKTPPC